MLRARAPRASRRGPTGGLAVRVLLLGCALAVARPVSGADFAPLIRATKRVAVLPPRNFALDTQTLYRTEAPLPRAAMLAEASQYLTRRLEEETRLDVMDAVEVHDRLERVKGFSEEVQRALALLDTATQDYRELRTAAAVAGLDEARGRLRRVFYEVVNGPRVAEACLLLGLARAELGPSAENLAQLAFREMFFYDPAIRLRRGYYPHKTERLIEDAQAAFLLTYPRGQPLGERQPEEPNREGPLLRQLGRDALVYLSLERDTAGQLYFVLHVFEGRRDIYSITFRERFRADSLAELVSWLDRVVARWMSCAVFEPLAAPPRKGRSFWLDANVAHSLFLKSPTREVFNEVGFGLGFAYQLLDAFDIHAQLNVFTVIEDPNKDLVRTFNAVRAVVGGGFTFMGRYVRGFVHPGLEFQYLSDFASTNDPRCKFWKGDPGELANLPCRVIDLDSHYLFGVNITVGVNFVLGQNFLLGLQAGLTYCFLPIGTISELNLPMTFQAGIGYAF